MFDNKYVLDFDEALMLIESFFRVEITQLKLMSQFRNSAGYWSIKHGFRDVVILISSDRGGLNVEVNIGNREINFFEFEPLMKNAEVASEKNIRFALDVVKRFVDRFNAINAAS